MVRVSGVAWRTWSLALSAHRPCGAPIATGRPAVRRRDGVGLACAKLVPIQATAFLRKLPTLLLAATASRYSGLPFYSIHNTSCTLHTAAKLQGSSRNLQADCKPNQRRGWPSVCSKIANRLSRKQGKHRPGLLPCLLNIKLSFISIHKILYKI